MARISGFTKDINGNVLGTCECYLFKDNLNQTVTWVAYTQSSALGAYSFDSVADTDPQYFVVSWKDNSPHVFDCTDHVLQPSADTGAFSMAGSGVLTLVGASAISGDMASDGVGSFLAVSQTPGSGDVASTGTGDLQLVGASLGSGDASMIGAGVMSVAMQSTNPGAVSMVGVGDVQATAPAGDPSFASVSLLLANEVGKADANTTFVDQSSNAFTPTRSAPFEWDTAILRPIDSQASCFGGSGGELDIADNVAHELGSGDFTIEGFVYTGNRSTPGTVACKGTFALGQADWVVIADPAGIYFQASDDGITADVTLNITPTTTDNTWYYWAVRRSGTSWTTAYMATPTSGGGTSAGDSTTSSITINNSLFGVIYGNDTNNAFSISNLGPFRVTKGVARNILTVPAIPFPTF